MRRQFRYALELLRLQFRALAFEFRINLSTGTLFSDIRKLEKNALRRMNSLGYSSIWMRVGKATGLARFAHCDMLFFGLLIFHLLPLWIFEFFPSQDGPSHLNNANIIRNYASEHVTMFREFYTLEHRFGVNWLIHLLLAGLMMLFPVLIAEKILLTAYIMFFMLALRYAVLAINKSSPPVAFLGFPLVYNRSMHMGFYSFIFSLAVFLTCLGYWAKHKGELNSWQQLMCLLFISLLLYLTHMLSLFMAVAIIAIQIIWLVVLEISSKVSLSLEEVQFSWPHLWFYFKPRILTMLPFAPSIFLVLLFLHDKQVGGALLGGVKVLLRQFISFQRIEAVVFGGLGILIILLVCTLKHKFSRLQLNRWDGLLLASLIGAMVYVIAPDAMVGGSYIRERLIFYPTLTLILWLAAQHYGKLTRKLTVAAASALAITGLVINSGQYKKFNDYFYEYVLVGNLIEPRTRVLPISFTHWTSPDVDYFTGNSPDPFLHLSGYVAAEKDLVDLGNYEAATNHFPTAFRVQRDPYLHIGNRENPYSDLQISSYYEKAGEHADYVLVWSAKGVDQDLAQVRDLRSQLNDGYTLLYTSPRGLTRLYRRVGYNPNEHRRYRTALNALTG